MSVVIEKASYADAEQILKLQQLAYRSEALRYNDFNIEPLTQTLEQIQQQFKDYNILKALADDQIVGSVRAIDHDGTCFIGKLMVHPDFQNKGIGKQLMNAIEGLYPNARFELFTGSQSDKNISLYENLGYKPFRERRITPDVSLIYLEKS
ncbi:GNAT family N-acetyltransferase [Paenibacillus sp. NEAU-GSW1]|uniref:GNAT family N-acetyltransferase n=1 Tax=Paenibacillus sp. NEAU-GSW1 TaxID=2682486 RepID=UPI0012E2955A|nr:GNAT family N-acetyltransferase [Paenibacillus sp. NEAU-GSW1]MUT67341.1 GNAT family N-acetyltransferase [Paenibacillus sp. NEAU-GSW1]